MSDLDVGYTVVHKLVRYSLKAKLKVPRPVHTKQKEGVVEEFKKNSSKTRRNCEASGRDSKKNIEQFDIGVEMSREWG
jgi:hypothetical protein